MLKSNKPYFFFAIFIITFGYCSAQESKLENLSAKYKDTLIIGIPNYVPSQLDEIKNVLSSLPDAQLVYVCEKEKRFMLLLKRKTYPDVSSIEVIVKTLSSDLLVYEKTGGWNSFFSVCKGEILKQQ